jgi:hypothetical protein
MKITKSLKMLMQSGGKFIFYNKIQKYISTRKSNYLRAVMRSRNLFYIA